jgi:predicted ATPase
VKRERAARRGEDVFVRPDEQDAADPDRLATTLLEQGHARKELRELSGFLRSIRYFHPAPHRVREPLRWANGAPDPLGGGLLEQIAGTPEKSRKPRLRLILEALRTAVPHLKQLEVRRDARGLPHLRARYEHWRSRGAWQTEEEFSDGTLRLMAILWTALDGAGPLLLEEPELSLHAAIVRRVPGMLSRMQRRSGRQVIVTTHSLDLFADEMPTLEEVFLLAPREEGTAVVPAIGRSDVSALLGEGTARTPEEEQPPAPDEHQLGLFEEE